MNLNHKHSTPLQHHEHYPLKQTHTLQKKKKKKINKKNIENVS